MSESSRGLVLVLAAIACATVLWISLSVALDRLGDCERSSTCWSLSDTGSRD